VERKAPCGSFNDAITTWCYRLTPIELGDKMAAPLAALWDPGEADEGCGDEKKLRADSPAI
jgi:hypothetical protein